MAESVIGALSVEITADAKGVEDGVKAAGNALAIGAKELRKSANQFGKWGLAGTTAAAAIGAAIVKMQLTTVRELKNVAFAANTTVEEFQRGAFAAEQFGISTEKYGDILKDTTERVGDFLTEGAGPMTRFFEQVAPKIGITADAFRGLSGQQALGLYIKSLQDANLSQQEMTVYMEDIASDSTRLIPLFLDNAKAMKAMNKEAIELGIGLSDIDVEKIEQANRKLASSAASTDAMVKQLTVELAPIISAVTDLFADMAKSAGGASNLITDGINSVVDVVGVFADGLQGIKIIFKGLEVAAIGFSAAAVIIFKDVAVSIANILDFMTEGVNAAIRNVNSVFDTGLKQLPKVRDSEFITSIEGVSDAMLGLVSETNAELQAMLMQKLPSEQIKAFVAEAQAEAQKLAEIAVNIKGDEKSKPREEAPGQSVDEFDKKKIEREKLATAAFLEELANRFRSAEELETNRFNSEFEKLQLTYANKNELTAEQNQLEKDLTTEHLSKLREIEEAMKPIDNSIGVLEALGLQYLTEEEMLIESLARKKAILDQAKIDKTISEEDYQSQSLALTQASEEAKRKITLQNVQQGFSALLSHSKKAQKMMQKVAIVQAVMKGKTAAVSAWEAGMATGGPWAPAVAASYAAASIANTASMISSIKSGGSSMSGMKSGGASSAGGGKSSAPQTGNTSSNDQSAVQSSRQISINMVGGGGLFSTDQVRELIGQINDQVGDGVSLITE